MVVRGIIYLTNKYSKIRKTDKLEEFYLDPLGLESYLLTESRCVNIEFDNDSTYFKVIVE